MRASILALALPLVALSACGGGGGGSSPTTLGSLAPVVSGNGTATNGSTTDSTTTQANFLDVSATTSFDVIGGVQTLQRDFTVGSQAYEGDAATVAAPSGTVSYSPRDGVFTVTLTNPIDDTATDFRFQDPLHRISSTAAAASAEVPDFVNFNYLQSGTASDTSRTTNTFFYQRPGTTTTWVTLAGFTTTTFDSSAETYSSEHAAMVFGSKTTSLQVPTSGTGSYAGDFLASMIVQSGTSPVFQWMGGTSQVSVDFAKSTISLAVSGTVLASDATTSTGSLVPVSSANPLVPVGSTFSATGTASISAYDKSFSGKATSAGFVTPSGTALPVNFTSVSAGTAVAGASSIDGAFYGPNAAEIGGNIRIVGGVADQRVDIHGAFTGKR